VVLQNHGSVIGVHALLTQTYKVVAAEPEVFENMAPVGHEPVGPVLELPVAHMGDGFGDGSDVDEPLVMGLVVKREYPPASDSPRA
jgi:hypothetical protein